MFAGCWRAMRSSFQIAAIPEGREPNIPFAFGHWLAHLPRPLPRSRDPLAAPRFTYGNSSRISSGVTRGRGPLWSPDQAVEPEDEAVHFREAKPDLYHQSR